MDAAGQLDSRRRVEWVEGEAGQLPMDLAFELRLSRDRRRCRVIGHARARAADQDWQLTAGDTPIPPRLPIDVRGLRREIIHARVELHRRLQFLIFEQIGKRE